MKPIKLIGRILSIAVTVILAVILLCNIYAVIARAVTDDPQPDVFGWSWAVVISGSMEPEIGVDDLIVVHERDTYEVGDVISFESGDSVVTHRIIEKTDGFYTTRGDANNTTDDPVSADAVIGKVVANVPYIGLVIGYLRTPTGLIALAMIGVLIFVAPNLIEKNTKEKEDVAE